MSKEQEGKMPQTNKKELFLKKMADRRSEARTIRKIVALVTLALIVIIVTVGVTGYFYISSALEPVNPESEKEIIVEIPIGSSVSTISQTLQENGLVKNAKVFKYYVKLKNESNFMAGEYHMNPSMTIQEIIESLKTGKIMQEPLFSMTIPEGKELDEIAAIIAENTKGSQEDILKKLNDESFIQSLISEYPTLLTTDILAKDIRYPLEGYLYPATYSFYVENPSLEEIVSIMLDKTESVVNQFLPEIENKKWTVHQFLTMSSLIEKEATQKTDRDKIASVFFNRMDINMPLQTDPTVLYAQGEHKDRVTYEDLEVDSPYNTYIHTGLPPGPIANAGTISMEAAVGPADTDFLYFLAAKDGTVYYSKTLEEHNALKTKYITNQ